MGYLADYVFYNSGNESPQVYHIWSGLVALSTAISRKVWMSHGYFDLFPNLYVVLVGGAGSGKNTAKNTAVKKLIMETIPDFPISASVTSREDVCKFMSGEQNLKTFRKPDDSIQEYRPFFFAVNELAGLLSVDFRKMVDFLVDLYDSEKFSTSFKRDEVKDVIPFPCATMLCGAVPEWFMRSLKMDLFSGGLGRRLTVVYEDRTILIDEPKIPPGGEEAWLRVCNHIRAANEFSGEMHMSESCKTWWKAWYMNYERLKSDDPILRQIYARKDVILKKVAMLTALDSLPFRLVLEPEDFIIALGMLDQLEPAIRKLSAGVGRNELAAISVDFVNFIGFNSGCASENQMKKAFFRECRTMGNEYQAMVNHLIQTEQVFAVNGKTNGKVENFFMTQERYEKYIKEGSKLNA